MSISIAMNVVRKCNDWFSFVSRHSPFGLLCLAVQSSDVHIYYPACIDVFIRILVAKLLPHFWRPMFLKNAGYLVKRLVSYSGFEIILENNNSKFDFNGVTAQCKTWEILIDDKILVYNSKCFSEKVSLLLFFSIFECNPKCRIHFSS